MKKNYKWLPEEIRTHVSRNLESKIPRGRGALIYRKFPEHLADMNVNGKPHVIFLSYYPYPNSIKKSVVLRDSDMFYTTFIGFCIRKDSEIEEWFDQAYELEDYEDFIQILKLIRASVLNITIQPAWFGALALEFVDNKTKIVIDVNDPAVFTEKKSGTLTCLLENHVVQKADAVVHKMHKSIVGNIWGKWSENTPDFQIHSYPYRRFFSAGHNDEYDISSGPCKIVYAGGVIPYQIAVDRGFENHVFDPIITKTDKKGIELTFFVNQNAKDMYWQEHDRYFAFAERFPHFHFKKGVPLHVLPTYLSEYHFGLLYDNIERCEALDSRDFTHNMSTKIFSYIEAGLPLLVYDRFEYLVEEIEKYGIGLIYNLDRLEELPDIIKKADYKQLKDNVFKYREQFELSQTLPALIELYSH